MRGVNQPVLQAWAKRWSLGCVNSRPTRPEGVRTRRDSRNLGATPSPCLFCTSIAACHTDTDSHRAIYGKVHLVAETWPIVSFSGTQRMLSSISGSRRLFLSARPRASSRNLGKVSLSDSVVFPIHFAFVLSIGSRSIGTSPARKIRMT